jgi:hypothetical protein
MFHIQYIIYITTLEQCCGLNYIDQLECSFFNKEVHNEGGNNEIWKACDFHQRKLSTPFTIIMENNYSPQRTRQNSIPKDLKSVRKASVRKGPIF